MPSSLGESLLDEGSSVAKVSSFSTQKIFRGDEELLESDKIVGKLMKIYRQRPPNASSSYSILTGNMAHILASHIPKGRGNMAKS